ncbi:MAG: hypothetical protein OXC40_04270 [Proteobacteria bacterium]|nr:hypothetical protein [Pseudomonadota bacterium]
MPQIILVFCQDVFMTVKNRQIYLIIAAISVSPFPLFAYEGHRSSYQEASDSRLVDATNLDQKKTQEVFALQELLLTVALKYFVPHITYSHTIKILDYLKKHSGLWRYNDPTLSDNCQFVGKDMVAELSFDRGWQVLGLSTTSLETLLHRIENAPQQLLTYEHLANGYGWRVHIRKPSIPYCYLLKHQNDLINAGIFNVKKFLPQIEEE